MDYSRNNSKKKKRKKKEGKKQHGVGLALPTLMGSEKSKDQTLERGGSGFSTRRRELEWGDF